MSKKLLNLLLAIMMLVVLVPTTLAAPPAQEEGQDYVVVADDWLSKLADKYLGNPLAYPAIVHYTNEKHAEDASYAEITDPDLIEVGWKIYIPSAEEAAALAPTLPPSPEVPRGGTARIAMWETRENFNPHMRGGYTFQSYVAPILQRLISFDADGNPISVLVTEIPSLENGGLSEDGKTITFHLRPGVKWADREPLTSADVKFTIEAVQNPDNIVTSRAGYDLIESVDTPDDLTVVLHYKEYYGAWMTIPWYVLPEHILGTEPNWNEHPWNTMPIGTGPFYMCENVPGDHFTLCKNEYYWEEGKPYLDKIIVLWVVDREALKARFKAGDYAAAYTVTDLDAPELMGLENVKLYIELGSHFEELVINRSPSEGPHMGDRNYENPIMADLRVLQALEMAIDKQEIVDTILNGMVPVMASHVPGGWGYDPTIPPSEYNPEKAKQFLDEAGWKVGPDGIREKDGVRMHITVMGSTAKYRMLYMQYIQQKWKDIGVEMEILTPEPSVRWAPYNEGGLCRIGAADIQAWGNAYTLDPTLALNQFFRCDQIPSDECPTCWNVARWCNEDFEKAMDDAERELDFEKRKEALRRAVRAMHDDLATVPLFLRSYITPVNTKQLAGWMPPEGKPNPWEYFTTYAADWYIPEE